MVLIVLILKRVTQECFQYYKLNAISEPIHPYPQNYHN